MSERRILVVDDNKETVRALRVYLEQAGFHIFTAYDGETALHILRRERPDLVVLDLMLPERDGWDVTRIVRQDDTLKDTPIIMLTARTEDDDKIVGLELGADDYITKPFNLREVVARVRSVLRRRNGEHSSDIEGILHYEGLDLDLHQHQLNMDGRKIDLTRIEFKIMSMLMHNLGHVFTRSELIESALDYDYAGMERSLDTHIKNLRKKVEVDPKHPYYIQTVYGVGYRLGSK
jgi:two-component system, OmpR family, alkaline phosphatase synthesis response regulator PhoP